MTVSVTLDFNGHPDLTFTNLPVAVQLDTNGILHFIDSGVDKTIETATCTFDNEPGGVEAKCFTITPATSGLTPSLNGITASFSGNSGNLGGLRISKSSPYDLFTSPPDNNGETSTWGLGGMATPPIKIKIVVKRQ